MKQEENKYFTFQEIINIALTEPKAISGKKEVGNENDLTMNVISDLTYSNIWNSFTKWCADQTELGYLINIYSLGNLFYVSEKTTEGIILKLSDHFLKEHNLKFDEKNSNYDKQYKIKYGMKQPKIEKLNYIAISTELNAKKILVQNGLNNIFNSIGYVLENNPNCQIDLGVLGIIKGNNKLVYQTPSKVKGDAVMNKKTTVQSLINRNKNYQDENDEDNEINNNNNNLRDEIKQQIQNKKFEEEKNNENNEYEKNIEKQINEEFQQNTNNENVQKTEEENKEIDNAKKVINEAINYEEKQKIKSSPEEEKNSQFNIRNVKDSSELPPVKQIKNDRIINIPFLEEHWNIKDMFHCRFKFVKIPKAKANPVLFNVYSNTKAAPFTAEKTQIPISHRIGSFYSLSLQNFIIDKTTKEIKRLYDEYFFKYKNIKFEEPASELEEYYYLLNHEGVNEEKIKLKKESYKRYQNFIHNSIDDNYIAVMKSDWIVQIIKMINRFYLMKQYDVLVNDSFKEITNDYKIAMKTAILDYILKHPEQKEKLNIPISFRRLKEYAEEKVVRPSDDDVEWKTNFKRNKLAISNNLYIMCENVTKIMNYFEKNLIMTSYVNLNEVSGDSWPTIKLNKFTENQKNQLEDEKQLVNENWRKFVENALKENKIYKDQLILYFKSISGLMSSELRKLIIGSIQKYYKFIKQFEKEKYYSAEEIFNTQFDKETLFQKSFIEVELKEHPSGEKFTFSDELSEIHEKLTNVVKDIIKYSQNVERADNMFIKNIDKHANLWQVPFSDSEVSEMYSEIDKIVSDNLNIIDKVTDLYEPFVFVMKEPEEIEQFLSANPKRDEFRKKITFYEEKLNLLENMPNTLYMNMIKINCLELNNLIREKITSYIYDLLKNILNQNILLKSKNLGEGCEQILSELKTQVNSEEILFKLENIAETCQTETIPQLKNDYEDFLEWVFFYLSYDKYKVYETSKDNVNSFEQSIKGCHDNFIQIDVAMKSFTEVLENQKKKFTADLDEERAKLLEDITKLKAAVDDDKENIKNKIYSDDSTKFLEGLEKKNKEALSCQARLKSVVEKEGYLGNPFTTEDERVDQALNDLTPMINYFTFINKYKVIYKKNRDEILWQLELNLFEELADQYNLFDISMAKIPTYKDRISRAKSDFESFKLAVELAKIIFPIVTIFQEEGIEDKEIYQDNKFYCEELSKCFPSQFLANPDEEPQQCFEKLRFYDIQQYSKGLEPSKQEMEKIVSEWKNVSEMYDVEPKMVTEIDIEFSMEKYNKKEFLVIKHDSYDNVIAALEKNIKIAEDKLAYFEEEPRDNIIVVKTFEEMKNMMTEMLNIIKVLKDIQIELEGYINKTADIKKKSENFLLLKQAEKSFKSMMDLIISKKMKIKGIFFEKDKFNSNIEDLKKIFKDLEKNLKEINLI